MSFNLLLKTQQELHENTAKWNKVVKRISNEVVPAIVDKSKIDKIIKEVFNEIK